MTSRIEPCSDATTTTSPLNLKNVKLKDRIHLFEGLSTSDKNTSSNNSSSQQEFYNGRYPKVNASEQKRWTQFETPAESVNNNVPPWLRGRDRGGGGTRFNVPQRKTSDASSKLANKAEEVPSNGATPKPMKILEHRAKDVSPSDKLQSKPPTTDNVDGSSTSRPSVGAKPLVQSDETNIVYIHGTRVKMRTSGARKPSKEWTDVQSCVSLMVNNFERRLDPAVSSSPLTTKESAVIPTKNVQRRSAEINETRTRRSKPEPDETTTIFRRRSKSVSHLDVNRENLQSLAVKPRPFKPIRTFEHDIYMETKRVITNSEMKGNNSTCGNLRPFEECSNAQNDIYPNSVSPVSTRPPIPPPLPPPQEGDTSTSALTKPTCLSDLNAAAAKTNSPAHIRKELPPIPNVAPYSEKSSCGENVNKDLTRHSSPVVSLNRVGAPSAHQQRPRSAFVLTSPVDAPERLVPAKPRRSSSSEAIDIISNPSYELPPPPKTEYAEPVVTLLPPTPPAPTSDMKHAVSEASLLSKHEDLEAVVDSEGYSVPGSHLWKKPDPPGERKKQGRVTTWKSTLTRGRKTDKKTKPHVTYTEPGTYPNDGEDDDESTVVGPIRQRSRLVTMRRKINDAFRRPGNHRANSDDDRSSVTSGDSAGSVDEEVMHKRITHARAVKQRSSVYCNPERYRKIIKDPKLYEYLVVVSLQFNEETRRYQPIEKFRYPEELSASQNDKLRAIPHFCFPDAFKWAPVEKYNSESYSFVLTSMDGSRLYGYNRRLLPPGDKPRLPEVYCIITPFSCRGLFTQLLDEIEKRRMVSKSESEKLIREARSRPVPPPGGFITIMQMDSDGRKTSIMKPLVLQRPQDSRLEHVDFDCLFSALKINQVIQIFASLLLERRVIMCSGKLSKLSKCSQAVAALLYPFAWQHVYIPVLPEKLVDMSCSPTPYIMGMLSLSIPKLDELPLEEVLIVDLDSKDFYTVVGDEETILPRKLSQALERALKVICSYSFLDNNEFEEELTSEDQEAKNRAISEAFIRYFVETCGHYTNHFSTKYAGNLKFDREGFIRIVTSRSIRRFLEVFTESQMFSLFIQEKEAEVDGIAQGLFETRVREWEAECKVNANKFGAKVKKIGRVVKDISREGGQKIAGTAKDVKTRVKANLDSKV